MGVEDVVCLEFQHSNLDRVQRVRVRRGRKKVLLQCQPLGVVDEATRTPEEPLDETSVLRTVEPGLFGAEEDEEEPVEGTAVRQGPLERLRGSVVTINGLLHAAHKLKRREH